MLVSEWYDIPICVSLGIVGGVLVLVVFVWLLVSKLENGSAIAQPVADKERIGVEA
jgi:hypothetical protein